MGLYQGSIIEFEDGNQLEINDANARAAIATLQNKLRSGYVVSVTPDTNAQGKEGIRITYDDNESVFLQVASKGLTFTTGEFVQYGPDGEITDNYYLHLLDEEGHDIEDFTPFALPDIASEGGLAFDTGYQDEEGFIHLTSNGLDVEGFTPFQVAGGSGSSDTYSVRMISGMTNATGGITNKPTLAYNDDIKIRATFYEKFAGASTGGNGTLVASVMQSGENSYRQFYTGSVTSDRQFEVDITQVVTSDKATSIKLEVTGEQSQQTATLIMSVTCVDVSISIDSNLAITQTTNFDLSYSVTGRGLKKIVYLKIDGNLYHYEDIGTISGRKSINIRATEYSYGAHDLEIWFETAETKSNVVRRSFIYDNGTSQNPIISAWLEKTEITYGDTIAVDYVTYTPNQETTDELYIQVYTEDSQTGNIVSYLSSTQTNITNNAQRRFTCDSYPEEGECLILLRSGDITKILQIIIKPIETDYNISIINEGLVYKYSAANKTNDDMDKEIYTYQYTTSDGLTTNIKAVSSGFNWVSDGYIINETSSERALVLGGNAKHLIRLPIFSSWYNDEDNQLIKLGGAPQDIGRTIEIEFKISNATNPTANVIKCMDSNHSGFIITPQNAWLTSTTGEAANVDNAGFIVNEKTIAAAYFQEDTRMLITFVIEPEHYTKNVKGNEIQYFQRINMYINGEAVNSYSYLEGYQFNSSEFISVGDSSCITRLYAVRCYNRSLSDDEVLQNYKASRDTVADKLAEFKKNDLLTIDGDIDYDKAKYYFPCLLITCDSSKYEGQQLSNTKSEELKTGFILTKPDGNGGFITEFSCMDVDEDGYFVSSHKVQGTTSTKFPIKNFKTYLKRIKNGEISKFKYSLKGYKANGDPISIPESTLCWKADYMSSDHANTFNADIADTLFQDTNESNNPAQGGDARVQNAVYGFRCLLFVRDIAKNELYFYADGCLNNDKGNTKTFGLEVDGDLDKNSEGKITSSRTKRQKWEFKDNSQPVCKFQTDSLQGKVSGGTVINAVAGLESCYPDQGDLEKVGLTPNYDYIQVLYTWICQRANYWEASEVIRPQPFVYNGISYNNEKAYRKAIFKNEFTKHFNLNHALIYYIFSQFVALSDNRAKNMFLSTKNVEVEHLINISGQPMSINDAINPTTGEVDASIIDWENSEFCIWYTDLYDLDSSFGVENTGLLTIPYYADWDYELNGTKQFSAYDSIFWLMFEDSMASEIAAKARELTARTVNGLNYESLYKYHITENAALIPPVVINRDMVIKYFDPMVYGFIDYSKTPPQPSQDEPYMYIYRGSRIMQKIMFMYRRCMMLYSRYLCSKFLDNNISFRNGNSEGLTAPNTSITVQSNQVMTPGIRFGDTDGTATIQGQEIAPGESATLRMPGTDINKHGWNDSVYICGATMLTSIGDISKWKPFQLILRNGINLKELIIGSEQPGYRGELTDTLTPSPCVLLEYINICGVPLSALNLRTNYLIKDVRADNGCTANILLPNGGFVERLHLGACRVIEVLNHPNMRDFSIESTENLVSLHVENTPNIPTLQILNQSLTQLTSGIRLIGINEELPDDTILKKLLSSDIYGKRIDANGKLVEDPTLLPVITGKVKVTGSIGTATVTQLQANYPDLDIQYTSTYTEYSVTFQNWDGEVLNVQWVPSGGDALEPLANGLIEAAPTRPSDEQYNYTFDTNIRWDLSYTNVTSNISPKAVFIATKRGYQVRWYNKDVLLNIADNVEYGSEIVYPGEIPIDDSGESEGIYKLFKEWDMSTGYITGNIDVHAIFSEVNINDTKQKDFSEMEPVDLYALIQDGSLDPSGIYNDYINCQDTINIRMGKDFNFTNVLTSEPVSVNVPRQFDGTNYLNTGIRLWDEDKSWTMVLDFKFESTAAGGVLASCFDNNGWRIIYGGSGPVFRFGSSTDIASGPSTYRDLIVIRRIKGDNNLYIYRCGKMNNEIITRTINNVVTIRNNAPLCLGAIASSTGTISDYGTGTIYWCKVWMDDLGDTVCKKLACWPRENLTFEASGKLQTINGVTRSIYNNFTSIDTSKPVHLTLLMKNLLDQQHSLNTTSTVTDGWPSYGMHNWCQLRIAKAFSQELELLLKTVSVSSIGPLQEDETYEIKTAADIIFIPSYTEVGGTTTNPYSQESNGKFAQFSNADSRIKLLNNGMGQANRWWVRTRNVGNKAGAFMIWETGGINSSGPNNYGNSATTPSGVCFGFNI